MERGKVRGGREDSVPYMGTGGSGAAKIHAQGGRCPVCRRAYKRSSEANSRYWALMASISDALPVQGQTFSPAVWHEYFKQHFLGAKTFTLPNGKELVIPTSSASLDTQEFGEYMERVEAWAAKRGVFLQELA